MRTKALRLPLLFAFAVCLTPALAQSSPEIPGFREARRYIEKDLAGWRPTAENAHTPPPGLLCDTASLAGTWCRPGGFESARLRLAPLGGNRYKVSFQTSGCELAWTLERTGTYTNGVLTLDRPVREYSDRTYQRLFTIQSGGGVRLVSDAAIATARRIAQTDRKAQKGKPQGEIETLSFWSFSPESRTVTARPLAPEPRPIRTHATKGRSVLRLQ